MSGILEKALQEATPDSGRTPQSKKRQVNLVGELPFADIATIGKLLASLGLELGTHLPSRLEVDLHRALTASATVVARPTYLKTTKRLQGAGLTVIDSGPVGAEGTHHWLEKIGIEFGLKRSKISNAQNTMVARIWQRLSRAPLDARILVAGTTGTELQIARLLVECGAEVPFVATSLPRMPWPSVDTAWLEVRGTRVAFNIGPRIARGLVDEFMPNLVVGPTTVCARARVLGIPSLNTAVLANCPMMGPTGAGPLSSMVNERLRDAAPLRKTIAVN